MPNREPYLRHILGRHVLTNSFVKSWDDGSHSHSSRPSLIELMKDQEGEVDRDVTDVRKCKYEMDMVQSSVNKLRALDDKTKGSVWPVWQCWNFKNEMKQLQDEMRHAEDDEMQELLKQHRLAEHNLHEWTDIRDEMFKSPAARKLADEIWQQVDHAFDARWVVVKLHQQREKEAEACRDEAKREHLLTRLATIANVIHWTEYIIGDAEHCHSSTWEQVHGTPSRTPSPPPGLAAGHTITLPHRPHDHLPDVPEPPTGLGLGLERPPSRRGRHEDAEHAVGKAGRYRMRRRYFRERY